ncbi:DUF397 domain-containing protein [Nocardia aurantiaca]|uniref:DUF397 domain-containing protein n=1 Tax=Nocardia aurantiaca TaxID=2675850 RepID=A0A6I3KXA5_9NOCA|nr:DUF397 domain-containing protein [Nocardia aurantiaca]
MTADLSRAHWFKSSHSADKADCVEVAFLANDTVGVRDSKNVAGPALVFSPRDWDAFIRGVISGKHHSPAG